MPEDVLSLKGKTGFTNAAKYCFAGQAKTPNGKWFLAVTGAQSSWREVYMLVKLLRRRAGSQMKRVVLALSSAALIASGAAYSVHCLRSRGMPRRFHGL